MKKTAVIFGAGNIGRGFIGQLFAESGCELVFADVDEVLLEFFNTHGSYDLQAVFNEDVASYAIGPVRGIAASDRKSLAAALATAEIAATAVGVRALPAVAATIAAGVEQRAAAGGEPLNIVICENLKNAGALVRQQVEALVAESAQEYLATSVGFVDAVIGRMVPPPLADMRASNPGLIRVEPYKELPVDLAGWRGPLLDLVGMSWHDNFGVFTARKLYIHNCGHAMLAYLGYQRGWEYGYEALADASVRERLLAGWQESARGIVHAYGVEPEWLQTHMRDLEERFANRALGDTVFRLGRDPIRKLAGADRLVAPAQLALEAGVEPRALAGAIAAAFRFDPPEDPVAVELQERLAREGLAPLLAEICGIAPESALTSLIETRFAEEEQANG